MRTALKIFVNATCLGISAPLTVIASGIQTIQMLKMMNEFSEMAQDELKKNEKPFADIEL